MSSRWYSLEEAAHLASLPVRLVMALVEEAVIGPVYEGKISSEQLRELRRARRLFSLGLNRAGVVVALRLRRQVIALQQELDVLRAEMDSLEAYYQAKQRRVYRLLSLPDEEDFSF
ncbi:MAG: hypothetical protein Q9O62_11435 [Ardenticatenia bacterium]|nr:hypothetical protein [Ardenticatenia bacterium]